METITGIRTRLQSTSRPESTSRPQLWPCHHCRSNKEHVFLCSKENCKLKYCRGCLVKKYDLNNTDIPDSWICFRCKSACTCSKCKKHDTIDVDVQQNISRNDQEVI